MILPPVWFWVSRVCPTGDEAYEEYVDEPDYIDELERLAGLKEKGILSEEEFEAKKKQLLGL